MVAESSGGGISVERLTEKHYKSSDGYYMKCSEHCENAAIQCGECDEVGGIIDRLGIIEDILGDDYDLGQLRELVQADREGRCVVLPCKVGDKIYTTHRCRPERYEGWTERGLQN